MIITEALIAAMEAAGKIDPNRANRIEIMRVSQINTHWVEASTKAGNKGALIKRDRNDPLHRGHITLEDIAATDWEVVPELTDETRRRIIEIKTGTAV